LFECTAVKCVGDFTCFAELCGVVLSDGIEYF
jgi:hypothetical protein